MIRIVHLAGLLWLAAAAGICKDQNKPPKPPPPPKAAAKPAAPKGGANGAARGGAQAGPPITNPANQAYRLYRLTPEERERALEKLPPQQQQRIQNQLKYFDSLPKDQQEMMLKRLERFDSLSPLEKREFTLNFQALNQLPQPRQQMVRAALRRLQVMNEADRQVLLNSPAFKSRFTPDEIHIIDNLSEVILPPM